MQVPRGLEEGKACNHISGAILIRATDASPASAPALSDVWTYSTPTVDSLFKRGYAWRHLHGMGQEGGKIRRRICGLNSTNGSI